jgi:glycosyltransferase involved in cell wall biosynthesis
VRIAFVTETWQPSVNGVVTRLAAHAGWLVAAGHEVLIIAPHIDDTELTLPGKEGVTVRRIPSFRTWVYGRQRWGWPLIGRVRRMLSEFRPDVVHVVGPFVLGIAGVVAARRLRVPLVASFHTDIAAYAGSYHLAWSRPIIWRILRALHNAAVLNLATSEHSVSLLHRHGVREVRLWRRGVDVERFTAAATARGAAPAGIPPVALYVGRIADEKHLAALLPLARSGRVRLMFVGDGPDRSRLEPMFAGTGTTFTGTLTGPDLVHAYAQADVFVFPSVTETLGLVLIEALAAGLPIVAVRSPASEELLGTVATARLIEPSRPEEFVTAVAELVADQTSGVRVRRAFEQAAGWDWAVAAAQVFDRYTEFVGAGAGLGADSVPVRQRLRQSPSGQDAAGAMQPPTSG